MNEVLSVISHSLIVFLVLLLLSRLMGRKLLSQLTFFDFVTGITIGTIAASYVHNTADSALILLSPLILTLCTVLVGIISLKSLAARKIFEGEPVVVIQNGKILEKNLTNLRYTLDDLSMQLREKGVFNYNDVEFAVLEPHGKLSMLKKSQKQPLTPKDLKLKTAYEGMASEIIKDGDLIEQNLKQNNLTFDWLYQELKKQNIASLTEVTLASLNTDGTLYIDTKNDNLAYEQKIED